MSYLVDSGKAFYWGTSEWPAAAIVEAHSLCERYGWRVEVSSTVGEGSRFDVIMNES